METYSYPVSFSIPERETKPDGFKIILAQNQVANNPKFYPVINTEQTIMINGMQYDLIGYTASMLAPDNLPSDSLSVEIPARSVPKDSVGVILYINIITPDNPVTQAISAMYYEDSLESQQMQPEPLYSVNIKKVDECIFEQSIYVASNQFSNDIKIISEYSSSIAIPAGSNFIYNVYTATLPVLPLPASDTTQKITGTGQDDRPVILVIDIPIGTAGKSKTKKGPIAIKTYGTPMSFTDEKERVSTKPYGIPAS